MGKKESSEKVDLNDTASEGIEVSAQASPPANSSAVDTPAKSSPLNLMKELRLQQDYMTSGAKKLFTTVPVHKPSKQDFVRVRRGEENRLPVAMIQLEEDGEFYPVLPGALHAAGNEWKPYMVFTAMNRQGTISLWPVKLPVESGRKHGRWSESSMEAAELAQDCWIRVAANMDLGAYEVSKALATIPEPEWPEHDFETLFKIAFKDRIITSSDHYILKKLRGEV